MRFILIFLAFITLSANPLRGEDLLSLADEGYGEYLSSQCLTCHQPTSDKGIPSIAGRDFESIVFMLIAYKDKEIENQVMQLVAGSLDDEQIASLALYFSKLPLEE